MGRRQRHFNPVACGMQVAFDARKISGLSNGASVSTWSGNSGTSFTATTYVSSGFTAPVYRSPANGINGNPAVEFNGSTNLMTTNAVGQFRNKASGDVFCVIIDATPSSGDTGHFPVAWIENGGAGLQRASLGSRRASVSGMIALTCRIDGGGGGGNSASGVVGNPANPTIGRARFDWAGNAITAFANGIASTTGTISAGSGNTSDTDSTYSLVGAANGPSAFGVNRFPGKIAAIYASSPVLSGPVAKRVSHALAFTYRIPCA